jgi:type IV pilus assembly protein PilW
MVGMALGLVAILIVAQVFVDSSRFQVTTAATGEAQSVGNLSLYTIERELKQAGFGMATPALFGCQLTGYNNAKSTVISKTLYPVEITEAASPKDSDAITIAYGSSSTRMGPILLATAYDGLDTDLMVQNRYGLFVNDFFILSQITSTATNCILGQITALPSTNSSQIGHAPAAGNYNKSNGQGIAFDAAIAELYSLGDRFDFNTYAVNASKQLVQQSNVSGNSLVIADNVFVFKARYGHDSGAVAGTVDTWDAVIPSTSAGWASTTNVRMGLAIKTPQRESDTVTASPLVLWPSGPSVDLTTEEQHYRYRTYNVVVPLRNMIWRTF